MVKFNSWFRERTTNLSDANKKKQGAVRGDTSLRPEDPQIPLAESNGELSDESPPKNLTFLRIKKKVKGKPRLIRHMGTVSSRVLDKLPGKGKPLYRRYWFLASLGISGSAIAIGYGIWSIDQTLPQEDKLNAAARQQTLTIKAGDGSILYQQGEATREKLNIEKIPQNLRQAFIASEDRRFNSHNGVDAQGIIRAFFNNLRKQDVVEGGSTITQQLARILFLSQDRRVWRKLQEVRLAQKLEQELTKDQILERYLNLVYLGSGAYGVADAAWVYFSKSVEDLTLGEMATIAGLAPSPNRFSPVENIEAATQRRNLVLGRMLEDGFITPAQKQAAVSEELNVKQNMPKRLQMEAPYFVTYVQKELPKLIPAELLESGGLVVETTLNLNWQKNAEAVVEKTLKNQGRWENFKQAALVAIDPRNGEIKAMVGGKDFEKNKFNRVTQAQRQPGSTFKGFVYAAAIASGKNPTDGYLDAPIVVDGYEPKNYDEDFRGWINMRDALSRSINIVAVRVLMKVGFTPTIKLAHEMGIKSDLKPMYSLALGSNELNLLELTSAYGTFATQGLYVEPHGITQVRNRQGQVIWKSKLESRRALDPTSAAIMTWMLRNVVQSGTGTRAQLGNRPVGGKTGTTDEARDLWFVGFIPQLVTGVWLGNDDNKPTDGNSSTAAYTWHEFMEEAVEDMPIVKFPDRPKLKGRKGSIKAQPIKPKKMITKSIPSTDDDDSGSVRSRPSRRRTTRRRRSSTTTSRSRSSTRRSRPRRSTRSTSSTSSRSRRRSTSRRTSSTSRSNRSVRRSTRKSNYRPKSTRRSSPPRRRSSSTSKPAAPAPKKKSSGASSAPPQQKSWRERLRPSE